jgi:hypothetical protein
LTLLVTAPFAPPAVRVGTTGREDDVLGAGRAVLVAELIGEFLRARANDFWAVMKRS